MGTLLPYWGLGGGFECNQSKLQLKNLNFEVKLNSSLLTQLLSTALNFIAMNRQLETYWLRLLSTVDLLASFDTFSSLMIVGIASRFCRSISSNFLTGMAFFLFSA